MTIRSPVTSTKADVNSSPLDPNINISNKSFIFYGTDIQASKFICSDQSLVGFHDLYVWSGSVIVMKN